MLTTKFLKGEQQASTHQIRVDGWMIKEFNYLTIDLLNRTEVMVTDFSLVGFIGAKGFETPRSRSSRKSLKNISQSKKQISLESDFEFSEN